MKKYSLYILLVIMTLSWSCQDGNDEGTISMEYAETNCENPWEVLPRSDNYLVNVRAFLEDYGITVITIVILNPDGESACGACNCLTTRNIVISTREEDQEKAEELGFTVQ